MITFQDVHKSFDDHPILQGVDLEMPTGKISVILGPSGEGKTVLLKHIMGFLQPDRGRVIVEGQDLSQLGEFELNQFRKKFGMLFQSAALFDSLTVSENVAFPLREHSGLSEEKISRQVKEKLALVGLESAADRMPSELSGGMRKRVGLARAIALEPKIILYDEPTTGLDPLMTDSINSLILETHKKMGATSILISHDIESAFKVGDFLALLHEGKILAKGSPETLRKSSHPFVQKFLGVRAA